MKKYIVAIDLGTSHITGIVGSLDDDGKYSVVACETADPASSIRKGAVNNQEDAKRCIAEVISKLESHLNGEFIDKIYAGIGGQSVHTVNFKAEKTIKDGCFVTSDDIKELDDKCFNYQPDIRFDIIGDAPAVYYVDGRKELRPTGSTGTTLEAHYKIIVGNQSLKRDIERCISALEKKGITIERTIASPLALADAMLSREEKELGCALVDFGAGVTSVSIFKNGDLQDISVIPLGSNLITEDIKTLQIPSTEAERLKKEYGSAIFNEKEPDEQLSVKMEGKPEDISRHKLNMIISGRIREIVENVNARIREVIDINTLGRGIVIAGGGSELDKLPELVREICKVKARQSAIRNELVQCIDDSMLGNPLYMMAISLMLKGTESCVSQIITPEQDPPGVKQPDEHVKEEIRKKRGLFGGRNKKKPKIEENPIQYPRSTNDESGYKKRIIDIFTEE